MEFEEKKNYLGLYRILQAKILRLGEMMDTQSDNAEKYLKQRENARAMRNKIEDDIDAVDGGLLTEILSQKYICGRSLEEIAFMTNYCKRQIERLHLKALDRLVIS